MATLQGSTIRFYGPRRHSCIPRISTPVKSGSFPSQSTSLSTGSRNLDRDKISGFNNDTVASRACTRVTQPVLAFKVSKTLRSGVTTRLRVPMAVDHPHALQKSQPPGPTELMISIRERVDWGIEVGEMVRDPVDDRLESSHGGGTFLFKFIQERLSIES